MRKPMKLSVRQKQGYRHRPALLLALTICLFFSGSAMVFGKAPLWHSSLSFPSEMTISSPAGLVIDQQRQRYYVIDYFADQLVSFDDSGKFLDRFDAVGGLEKPVSMAFGAAGKMWVVQRSSNELLYIDLTTRKVRHFDLSKTLSEPIMIDRVATDDKQRLYVADSHSGRIYRLDDNLKIAAVFAAKRDSQLSDFKIIGAKLYALDSRHQQLLAFNLDGQAAETITLEGQLDQPVSFARDAQGTWFVLDRPQGKIAVFNATGKYLYDFCRRGARRGQLNYPAELHFDWLGRLCVVNQGNDRIEVFKH